MLSADELRAAAERARVRLEAEGEIDLESFETMEDVRRSPGTWLQVREILESRQMPPRKSRQPTENELILLQRWVESYLRREAEAQAERGA